MNGCGASAGFWRWVRPPQGHARRHCDDHDLAYDLGGTSADRRRADWDLLLGLLGDATDRPFWQRPVFRIKAIVYYLSVRLFAAGRFHYRPAA